ncbi:DUF4432 family protein [Paenibacillus sp. LMG 31460]|uniref:DUF4432 family protein n=1 Tax=Paenibacillus germinis TaxID=2654979 RepID=A0ABX1Z8Y8_9BACL|nr:DUF4432 family protein [Paenibacillus germinis]NOU88381.1 DUF4432 family protein [Paenibacillus germinis]
MSRYRPQRNYGCRIHDQYTYFGMRTIVLENNLVRISILAGKGTEIFEYLYKPKDLDFMWLTENGVQNPRDYLPTSPDPISTFVDYYPGGWQEVFPNGGPTSVYLGAQFGQHGEVAHMPWDYEIDEDTVERVAVSFRVRTKKMPFQLTKTVSLRNNSPTLILEEKLENLSDIPLRYMWGQHIAFGKPFLRPGCRIYLPDRAKIITESVESPVSTPGRVRRGVSYDWPYGLDKEGRAIDFSVLPSKGTPSEMIYLYGFGNQAWYRVENKSLDMGMKVAWDGAVMPYLWYWQEFGASKGYPWYGRNYNIGLEPFSSYPTLGLGVAVRNNSAGIVESRGVKSFWLKATPYSLNSIS